ncbi:protein DMR6-LIKE OXYGENASE 1 isoform X1 [Ananas comosus]|uniref:Protein DMR6-LIKE OXYGENASE 1 isoform X1 n=1 Tax=Ananas comosus TaxID=4615 RepID=A0A6P5HME9_ANACO|nr:protein DMR6-LIKE OXYGENASE 1 isoform X1 [Ananas comosus]
MAMDLEAEGEKKEEAAERQYMEGVKQLCESGIKKVPNKYILPASERPRVNGRRDTAAQNLSLKLPVIDLSLLHSKDHASVIQSLEKACEEYGFFQIVNHGIPIEVIRDMVGVVRRFFELPFEERSKYMSSDIRNPVRYGTSFNQMNDKVFSWRDFLKLSCHPISSALPFWPSSPADLRDKALLYVKEMKSLFMDLMEAILETLGVNRGVLEEFRTGSHILVANCYPVCPEPGLTLGMPPHSDYGFLTLLLQDDVEGLQIQHGDEWVTVEPVPDSLVVNIGDHFEIFSNGRYKSVLHRVLVNPAKLRISVASLHSLPIERVVGPSPDLVDDDDNPRRYMDTDFASFLDYIASCESKHKNFLESRRLTPGKALPDSQPI